MKTIVAISFSFLALLQSAGLGTSDFLLLLRLVRHVEYHSDNYCDNVYTFFEKHYGALKAEHRQNHNDDEQEHQELPFQHNYGTHLAAELILASVEITLLKSPISRGASSNFQYRNLYSSLEKTDIFQPPRFL